MTFVSGTSWRRNCISTGLRPEGGGYKSEQMVLGRGREKKKGMATHDLKSCKGRCLPELRRLLLACLTRLRRGVSWKTCVRGEILRIELQGK